MPGQQHRARAGGVVGARSWGPTLAPGARRSEAGGAMREHPLVALYRVGMPYAVQTSVFEGPFDLLLHLILREQVDLYEVSLATIVDAYLVELDRMQTCDLEIATEFL